MKIGTHSGKATYNDKKAIQSSWATEDSRLNMICFCDAASRLYFCMMYGLPAKSATGTRKTTVRHATAGPNARYVRDDLGDKYANKTTSNGGIVLTAINKWQDEYVDGFCTVVGNRMVTYFSVLECVTRMTVPESSTPTTYPQTGPWVSWKRAAAPKKSALAKDSAGRILPAKEQAMAWTKAGNKGKPPTSAIRQ
ncbi:hypothetical protein MMPV_004327 [Pyropia vietnamensis]